MYWFVTTAFGCASIKEPTILPPLLPWPVKSRRYCTPSSTFLGRVVAQRLDLAAHAGQLCSVGQIQFRGWFWQTALLLTGSGSVIVFGKYKWRVVGAHRTAIIRVAERIKITTQTCLLCLIALPYCAALATQLPLTSE